MADEQGPICISVINMKGGVGKTTIASMLAREAATRRDFSEVNRRFIPRHDILAIDLDPQANLSQALMGESLYRRFLNEGSPSIVDVFNGYQAPAVPLDVDSIVHNLGSNLQLIPSRFHFSDNLIRSIGADERVLARLIANRFQDKDLIIIDCAPTESIFTKVAYHASNYILVPVKPEFLATIGFPLLGESLNEFKLRNPTHPLSVIGVVINNSSEYLSQSYYAVERTRALREIYDDSRNNNWYVFENQLRYSRGFPKIMRGDFSNIGDAYRIFGPLANEFFEKLGI